MRDRDLLQSTALRSTCDDEQQAVNTAAETVTIVDLRDAPQFRETVIDQNYAEWASTVDMDRDTMAALFAVERSGDSLPVTLIAVANDKYLGCISLREGPLGIHKYPDAYHPDKPWISNIWVAAEARGQGLATRLIDEMENVAKNLGYRQLYISTFVADSLYDRLGYADVSSSFLKERPLRSLRKSL